MKTYLGDSVYAEFDGEFLVLTTNNGGRDTNRIFLEPQVIDSLLEYIKSLSDKPQE